VIVVLLHDASTGQISLAMEPQNALAALQICENAVASIKAQLQAPKLIMPNGEVKPVMPEQNPAPPQG
jgi:hypothetical protein